MVTKNLTPGESVYGEKRIQVPNAGAAAPTEDGEPAPATTTEYRVWNPFRSKLAAGILGGMESKLPRKHWRQTQRLIRNRHLHEAW